MLNLEKLKKLREKAGLTQEQAAQRSGISSRQAWNNIERGRQQHVTIPTLDRIAKALGVKAKDLLE